MTEEPESQIRDNVDEINEFVKRPIDENSQKLFSQSVKLNYNIIKVYNLTLLEKLLKYMQHLFDTKDGYMLFQEPHQIFIAMIKCCSSQEVIQQTIILKDQYISLIKSSFEDLRLYSQVMEELLLEQTEEINIMMGVTSKQALEQERLLEQQKKQQILKQTFTEVNEVQSDVEDITHEYEVWLKDLESKF